MIQAPHLFVKPSVEGDVLAVEVDLVSRVAMAPATDSLKAFLAIDGVPIILYMPAGGTLSLAFPRVAAGRHSIHYGIYYGDTLYQNICETVTVKE